MSANVYAFPMRVSARLKLCSFLALARTERKTSPGYKGFDVHASPDVTLEQDLERRDLTFNAIAKDENGEDAITEIQSGEHPILSR